MGAGHCPWGGYTDRIVCNVHGEERLAYQKSCPLAAAEEVVTDGRTDGWMDGQRESQTIIMDLHKP